MFHTLFFYIGSLYVLYFIYRYFHGLNVVVKGPPWLPRMDVFDPNWSFVEKDMQVLQELGFNAIR